MPRLRRISRLDGAHATDTIMSQVWIQLDTGNERPQPPHSLYRRLCPFRVTRDVRFLRFCDLCVLLRLIKFSQKLDFADEINTKLFFDGGGHLLGKLPDILRGATGVGDDDVGVLFVNFCSADFE